MRGGRAAGGTSDRPSERVWGATRESIFELLGPIDGFRAVAADLDALGRDLEGIGEFRPRDEVEEDPGFQQIIPYVAVTCRGRVLLVERLAAQSESRLHRLLSIGIGGHVNPEPPGPGSLLRRGLERELREELVLASEDLRPSLLGFVNDDSNPVGSVHFGIAARLDVRAPVAVRERDRMRGEWVSVEELAARSPLLESWSRHLLPALRG